MDAQPRADGQMNIQRVTLPICGLGCGGEGALIVERALANVPGVVRVYVNPATEMAYVQYDPALTGPDRLSATIEAAGFGPTGLKRLIPSGTTKDVNSTAAAPGGPGESWLAVLRRALRLG